MAVSFDNTFLNFMLVGIVILSIFASASIIQLDNDVLTPFLDNDLLGDSFTSLKDNLTSTRNSAQSQKNLFDKENPTLAFGTLLFFSIVSSGKIFGDMTVGLFNILLDLPTKIFGIDPIIVSVISTILLFGLIFSLWYTYKLGG